MLFQEINYAFERGDCQAVAAYLGAMMHVITDATFYAHLFSDVRFETEYASHALYTTYKKWSEGTRRYPIGNEFFTVTEARNSITVLDTGSPYIATALASKDTRFGWFPDNPNGFQTARWMSEREAYWDSVKGHVGVYYGNQLTWTYSDRPDSNNDITKYFNTIEHNLNTAIIYSAAALNFVLEYGIYTDCSCIGDWPGQDDGQGQGQRDRTDLKVQVDEFTGLFFFNIAGLFATGVALALLSKLNIIKIPIPA